MHCWIASSRTQPHSYAQPHAGARTHARTHAETESNLKVGREKLLHQGHAGFPFLGQPHERKMLLEILEGLRHCAAPAETIQTTQVSASFGETKRTGKLTATSPNRTSKF